MYDFKDFRETALYKHMVLVNRHYKDMQPIDAALKIISKMEKDDCVHSYFACIKDAQTFSDCITTDTDVLIEVPLGTKSTYDGIYDIWLRDCTNVASISVMFDANKMEIPIEFKLLDDRTIQIPLAFLSDGGKVKEGFYKNNNMSFIPSIAIQFDRLFIKLNAGAQCNVCISTIYCQTHRRRVLAQRTNTFYVNGVPLQTMSGQVFLASDARKIGCTIS
jgi:hypothetical protein